LILWGQVDFFEELGRDGETSGRAESVQSSIFVVVVVVQVITASIPGTIDGVTTGVVFLYVWRVVRHGRCVVYRSSVVICLRQIGNVTKDSWIRSNSTVMAGEAGEARNSPKISSSGTKGSLGEPIYLTRRKSSFQETSSPLCGRGMIS
jgi:hypothetical protein